MNAIHFIRDLKNTGIPPRFVNWFIPFTLEFVYVKMNLEDVKDLFATSMNEGDNPRRGPLFFVFAVWNDQRVPIAYFSLCHLCSNRSGLAVSHHSKKGYLIWKYTAINDPVCWHKSPKDEFGARNRNAKDKIRHIICLHLDELFRNAGFDFRADFVTGGGKMPFHALWQTAKQMNYSDCAFAGASQHCNSLVFIRFLNGKPSSYPELPSILDNKEVHDLARMEQSKGGKIHSHDEEWEKIAKKYERPYKSGTGGRFGYFLGKGGLMPGKAITEELLRNVAKEIRANPYSVVKIAKKCHTSPKVVGKVAAKIGVEITKFESLDSILGRIQDL
jgi:hypothetical protein